MLRTSRTHPPSRSKSDCCNYGGRTQLDINTVTGFFNTFLFSLMHKLRDVLTCSTKSRSFHPLHLALMYLRSSENTHGCPVSPPQTSHRTTQNRSTLPIPSTGGFTEPSQRSGSHIGVSLHSNRTSNVFMANEKERKRSSSQKSWFKRHSGEPPSNSHSDSNSTGKFANSVFHMLKLMSPMTLKRRLNALGKTRETLDSAYVYEALVFLLVY